jgi:phage terminase large subunit-like protein
MSYFDERAATVAERFFDRMLVHIEGPMAGKPFILEPWQRSIVREVFGRKRDDGLRQYRKVYIELPRGNGKSTWCSGFALHLLAVDGERSAKVYSAAADKSQAAIVFETAEKMVSASPFLSQHIRAFRNRTMEYDATGSKYLVLSSDAFTKHGLNPSGIIFDELHAQPNRELYDVLNTAMGKRAQPLMIMITTAGYDRNSICWEQHEYALKVRAGIIEDPTFLPVIYAADTDDEWTSPATWRKANPNFGVSVKEDFLWQECQTALQSPAYQNTFRRLYLNQWTQQETRWIDMKSWDGCNGPLPDLAGRTCYGGLDLASTTDIAACVLTFPPVEEGEPTWLLPFFWIPTDNMIERERRDRVPYSTWVREGLVEATPGNVIDYAYIRARINALKAMYDIQEVAYDPWNATQLSLQLQDDGIVMVEMRQGFASMTAPSKELLRLVLAKQVAHAGNPVLRWMADNVTARSDPAGNVKPDKGKSTNKIDGIVASIMALARLTANASQAGSMYDDPAIVGVAEPV